LENCLFCKIIAGEIPSDKVYEDDRVLAIRDIAPMAPTHVLVMPKAHVTGIGEAHLLPDATAAALFAACAKVAALERVDQTGYRTIANTGADACQSVPHLHLHVLGGKPLSAKMD